MCNLFFKTLYFSSLSTLISPISFTAGFQNELQISSCAKWNRIRVFVLQSWCMFGYKYQSISPVFPPKDYFLLLVRMWVLIPILWSVLASLGWQNQVLLWQEKTSFNVNNILLLIWTPPCLTGEITSSYIQSL